MKRKNPHAYLYMVVHMHKQTFMINCCCPVTVRSTILNIMSSVLTHTKAMSDIAPFSPNLTHELEFLVGAHCQMGLCATFLNSLI